MATRRKNHKNKNKRTIRDKKSRPPKKTKPIRRGHEPGFTIPNKGPR